VLREGAYADVIVFDPATVKDRSTYIEPTLLAIGMQYVFVNGVSVIEAARATKATPGKALKGSKAEK
jgi:N-acyl-D-amino-acid deacylase